MNKKFFLAIAAVAITLVSCSQNDQEVVNIPTSDAISLNPSTAVTRASISFLSTLQGDNNGFAVYADNGASPSTWHDDIRGINHTYNAGKWNFTPPVKWPTEPEKYPMTFFAFFPTMANSNGVIQLVNGTHPNVKLSVEVPSDKSAQRDLLAGQSETASKPTTSILRMQFEHILSKVWFTVSNSFKGVANTTQNVYVQAIGFKNLQKTNDYDVREPEWLPNPAKNLEVYNYYNDFVGGSDVKSVVMFNSATVSAGNGKFYTGTAMDESYMMLLPHNAKVWNTTPSTVVAPDNDNEAYVKMLYRVEETVPVNDDFIGYKSAVNHPQYDASNPDFNYTGPLYVLVGFSYTSNWVEGNGYQYDIPVPGTTGGRLLEPVYYDEKGNPTHFEVEYIDVPDVILPDDDDIHLDPIVTKWDDSVVNVIQQ